MKFEIKTEVTGFSNELRIGTFVAILTFFPLIFNFYAITSVCYFITAMSFIIHNHRYESYKEWLILALGLICLILSTGFFVLAIL